MIRANLLPREPSAVQAFGLSLAVEDVRRCSAVLLVAACVVAAISSVQIARARRLENAAAMLERRLDLQAEARTRIAILGREVARLQRIERESLAAHYTGNAAAVEVAAIGNAIPSGVWLSGMEHRIDGYFLSGGAPNIQAVAETLRRIATTKRENSVRLSNLTSTHARPGLSFSARLNSVAAP
jgi:hypothetical protein